MGYRKSMSKSYSKRVFKKNLGVRKINRVTQGNRGGIRL